MTCQGGTCSCPVGQALCPGQNRCIATSECIPGVPGNTCDLGCMGVTGCVDTGVSLPNGTPLTGETCDPGLPLPVVGSDALCHVFDLACTGGIASCTFDTGAPLPDESQCQQDGRAACCGGSCVKLTEFCPDIDGDGFGKEDASNLHFQCPNDPVPTGLTNCLDCCDSDKRAYPGSPWCDTVPPMPGPDGKPCAFDYNCDGVATPIACNLTDPSNHFVDVTKPFDCLASVTCDSNTTNCPSTCSGVSANPPAGAPDPCATACFWQDRAQCGAMSNDTNILCTPGSNGCMPFGTDDPGPIQSCN
jgi:hypothetical protein